MMIFQDSSSFSAGTRYDTSSECPDTRFPGSLNLANKASRVKIIIVSEKKTATMTGNSTTSSPDLLLDRLAQGVEKQPSKPVFSFVASGLEGGRVQKSLTYEALAKETSELAQRLLEAGLTKGDRYVKNCCDFLHVVNKLVLQ
jgi:hypothetical protein